jgi:uncharacterized protein (TIGR03066 family)
MKTKLGFAALICAALFLSGCGSSPESLIIGKWQAGETGLKLTAEFGKDGTAKLNMFGHTVRGTYKIDGDDLEWTLGGKTTKCKAKVTDTEMELTSEGKTITYKKI